MVGRGDRGGYESMALQYLRAVAAIMVVAFHAFGVVDPSREPVAHASFLLGGVDLFFVISGFVMWTSTADAAVSPLEFYRRRLIRIVPLYWLLTSVLVAVMLIRPSVLRTASFDLEHAAASYAFLAWPHPRTGEMFPVLVPGWTLNYEMAFYLVFGALLLLPKTIRLHALTAIAGLVCLAGFLVASGDRWLSFYTDTVILEFAAGAWLGKIVSATRPGGGLKPAIILGVGAGLLVTLPAFGTEVPRALLFGPPAVMVVWGAVWLERAAPFEVSGPLAFLGDASYSIYLVHPMVLAALARLETALSLESLVGRVGFFFASVAAATVCGALVHVLVERPLSSRLGASRTRGHGWTMTPKRSAAGTHSAALPNGRSSLKSDATA